MKQLTCEVCGGNDLLKQDGVFVCQSCGCKYSADEVKKLMVQISEPVKVEGIENFDQILNNANTFLELGQIENANKLFVQLTEKYPSRYEGWWGVVTTRIPNFLGEQTTSYNYLECDTYISKCYDTAKKFCPLSELPAIESKVQAYLESVERRKDFEDEQKQIERQEILNKKALCEKNLEVVVQNPNLLDGYYIWKDINIDCKEYNGFRIINNTLYQFCYNAIGDNLRLGEVLKVKEDGTVILGPIKEIYRTINGSGFCFNKKYDGTPITSKCYGVFGFVDKIECGTNEKQFYFIWSDGWNNKKSEAYRMDSPPASEFWAHRNPSYDFSKLQKIFDQVFKSKAGCYIATSVYGSYDCPEVWTLRRFRDYTLSQTWYGRAFIKTYYTISPILVKWFGNTTWFQNFWKNKLDRMVCNLKNKGFEDKPYDDRKW